MQAGPPFGIGPPCICAFCLFFVLRVFVASSAAPGQTHGSNPRACVLAAIQVKAALRAIFFALLLQNRGRSGFPTPHLLPPLRRPHHTRRANLSHRDVSNRMQCAGLKKPGLSFFLGEHVGLKKASVAKKNVEPAPPNPPET